jgi:predicted permease
VLWLEQLLIDLRQRIRSLVFRERMRRELEREIEFHLQMRKEQLADENAPEEAGFAARRRFGNVSEISEVSQQMWQFGGLDALLQDVRYGCRTMMRTPGIAAVAVLSLALGIGANAGIFALVDRVMLRLLPVKDPQELVTFGNILAYPEYRDVRDRNAVFDGMAGMASLSAVPVGDSDNPADVVNGRLVTGNYFEVLGVRPMLGRTIAPQDDGDAGASPVVVISYALWRGHFHGEPSVIGQTLRLGAGQLSSGAGTSGFEEDRPVSPVARDFTIIGVLPRGFAGETVGERADFFTPMSMEEHFLPGRHWLTRKSARWVRVIARLRPGVSRRAAEAGINVVDHQYLIDSEGAALTPSRRRDIQERMIHVLPGDKGFSDLREEFAKPLWVLMGMVATVLFIACANLANLLLARSTARRREFATRLALGVSRARLMRQLITEGLLVSFLGAALSVPVGWGISRALFAMVSAGDSSLRLDIAPDGRVLGFTAAVAILTTLLFALLPAIRSTKLEIGDVLKENARSATGGRGQFAASKSVVVVQVALSVVLLFGTGLLIRTLYNLQTQDLGYAPEHLLIARLDPTGAGYKGDEIGTVAERILEAMRRLPGIRAASYSDNGLFAGTESGAPVRVEGFAPVSDKDKMARYDQVGPDYFHTVGIPLLLGRDFKESDRPKAPRVAVINESMAKFYFGKRSPIGQTLFYDSELKFALTIVGVAKDVRDHTVRGEPFRRFYVSYMQPVDGQMDTDYEIRTAVDVGVMEREIRAAVHGVAPRMRIVYVHDLPEQIANSMVKERLVAELSVLFGALALVLGCVGLYAIMAYSVARRTQEIGIRMALGAGSRRVVWAVVQDAMVLVVVGLAIGIPCALGLSRYVQSLLFGLKATDALSLAGVIAAMALMAFAAAMAPARRAARVDPIRALRYE